MLLDENTPNEDWQKNFIKFLGHDVRGLKFSHKFDHSKTKLIYIKLAELYLKKVASDSFEVTSDFFMGCINQSTTLQSLVSLLPKSETKNYSKQIHSSNNTENGQRKTILLMNVFHESYNFDAVKHLSKQHLVLAIIFLMTPKFRPYDSLYEYCNILINEFLSRKNQNLKISNEQLPFFFNMFCNIRMNCAYSDNVHIKSIHNFANNFFI